MALPRDRDHAYGSVQPPRRLGEAASRGHRLAVEPPPPSHADCLRIVYGISSRPVVPRESVRLGLRDRAQAVRVCLRFRPLTGSGLLMAIVCIRCLALALLLGARYRALEWRAARTEVRGPPRSHSDTR